MVGRREHEPETVWRAQELYCADRLSFDAVAQATGVAASTLKRWSEKYGWQGKREKIARAESDIRADTILARSKMLKTLIKTRDPQAGFAVSALENLALKQAEAARKGLEAAAEADPRPLDISDEAVVVEALQEAVRRRLDRLVRQGVDLASVKEIRQALDLIKSLAPKRPDSEPQKKSLDPETLKAIKEQIYGLT